MLWRFIGQFRLNASKLSPLPFVSCSFGAVFRVLPTCQLMQVNSIVICDAVAQQDWIYVYSVIIINEQKKWDLLRTGCWIMIKFDLIFCFYHAICWTYLSLNFTNFAYFVGSKEETFFDSQPWLESDCEDDFFSVNGGKGFF